MRFDIAVKRRCAACRFAPDSDCDVTDGSALMVTNQATFLIDNLCHSEIIQLLANLCFCANARSRVFPVCLRIRDWRITGSFSESGA